MIFDYELVTNNHLLRYVDAILVLNFAYRLVEDNIMLGYTP